MPMFIAGAMTTCGLSRRADLDGDMKHASPIVLHLQVLQVLLGRRDGNNARAVRRAACARGTAAALVYSTMRQACRAWLCSGRRIFQKNGVIALERIVMRPCRPDRPARPASRHFPKWPAVKMAILRVVRILQKM